jgi:Fanconi anemia group D2 protein
MTNKYGFDIFHLFFRNLLSENSELTVPILDALSNLYLKPDILTEVRTSVLQSLPSIDQEALPVAVKFLMQSVNNQDAPGVRFIPLLFQY